MDSSKPIDWLSHLTRSKYVAIIYNERGDPLEALNRVNHRLLFTVEHLLRANIHDYYALPKTENLNTLLKDSQASELYPSRNKVEYQAVSGLLVTRVPLSSIQLFAMEPNRFVGLISFRDHFIDLPKDKPAVVTGPNETIIAYNDLFQDAFLSPQSGTALDTYIHAFVHFNQAPLTLPKEAVLPRLMPGIRWHAGNAADPPFIGPVKLKNNALKWENADKNSYAYLQFSHPVRLAAEHFEIRIRFQPLSGQLPNLILAGSPAPAPFTPDLHGFTLAGGGNVCRFKSPDHVLREFDHPSLDTSQFYWLTVRKIWNEFSWLLDEKEIGRCRVQSFFPDLNLDRLFLFLRPGEALSLQAMETDSALLDAEFLAGSAFIVMAGKQDDARRHQYKVSYQCRVLENANCTLFTFEDVTALTKHIESLKNEKLRLTTRLIGTDTLIGVSPAMEQVRKELTRVAKSELSVLIEGETGTGKEVLARAIHEASPRKKQPFVKIDCAAIPQTLLESELFGHEKGAFTGAVERRIGRFESANGGTLFLDEIANLPLPVQVKLLGVLQDRTITRLGGNSALPVDVRLISAGNIPVEQLMAQEAFRQDLYYRLNQFRFTLPPLRERREDIGLLARHFAEEACLANGLPLKDFTPGAMALLFAGEWPGNVRELRNAVFRAVLLSDGTMLSENDLAENNRFSSKHLSASSVFHKNRGLSKRLTTSEFKNALAANHGNVAQTARALDISRVTAYAWMKKL